MLLLGVDVGTSSIKVSVVDAQTRACIASAQFPESETEIIAIQSGWAEQNPDMWWENVNQAILKCHATESYKSQDIAAIGIAYQMHGLVLVDQQKQVLRNSIIWCDSRAVETGNRAFEGIGKARCLSHLLNSPGNFTASKLAWVKENEPQFFDKTYKVLLPGDFIAMKFTDEMTTTPSALSEGVFWDFTRNEISRDVKDYFNFPNALFPGIAPVFSSHGFVRESVAAGLSLKKGIPVTYKAGDQPNNAVSLNVFDPGEVAATAGTSGVIYGVSDQLNYDEQSRINGFAHVNHSAEGIRIGNLLCINGAGIFNRWIRNITGTNLEYSQLNEAAAAIERGSEGLIALPFGNGAERMLNNRILGAGFLGLDFNVHTTAHLIRAVQEGIAFSFRYGLDIMKENGMDPKVIRAGRANMFLSDVFSRSFAGATGTAIELYPCDGSIGAAMGAGLGAGFFNSREEAFGGMKALGIVEPEHIEEYEVLYRNWKAGLKSRLQE